MLHSTTRRNIIIKLDPDMEIIFPSSGNQTRNYCVTLKSLIPDACTKLLSLIYVNVIIENLTFILIKHINKVVIVVTSLTHVSVFINKRPVNLPVNSRRIICELRDPKISIIYLVMYFNKL